MTFIKKMNKKGYRNEKVEEGIQKKDFQPWI
jgi:hypothetical protein